ncbi:hypothetical protein ACLF3G_23640 [Falsiroseomonas sp. HC035]|uniref:hypothetical protein n=1 Tax=Falsiroseomonas sp. HC035 TaxID=3390999 RepID=UPI003D3225CE
MTPPANDAAAVPSLRTITSSNEYRSRVAEFPERDTMAVRQQTWLFRLLGALNLLVLGVGVLSGLILAGSVAGQTWSAWKPQIETATWVCCVAITVFTILATISGQFVRDGDRLGRWRALPSQAELARGQKFATLARLAAAAGPGPARETLDVVCADLLEDQRKYYTRRAERHRSSAGITSLWTGVALALSALASAAAFSLLFDVRTEWLFVVGVLATAVSAYVIDRENLYRDRSNADLYDRTAEKLRALASGVDRVAAEIASGNPQAVVAFTDLVVEELQAEHRQWLVALDVTADQLNRLDERLRAARARTGRESPGAATVQATPLTGSATSAPPAASVTSGSAAAELARWRPLLTAAANALPAPQAERARLLLAELSTVVAPLDSAAPASSSIAAAAALADRLRAENPLGQWLTTALPALAPTLGAVLPPLGVILGIAAIGARLSEDAYRRWVARVLQAPFSPGLIEPQSVTSNMVLAVSDVSTLETKRRC